MQVKIDNCGSSHNVSYYSELFNRSGKAIRIEDCHTSPTHPDIASDGSVICPMNMYRAGGDIKASFGSIIGEIYSTIEWNDRKKPLSFPGCWSYPDMMQVGNFRGPEPLRSAEERTHFSLWVINSAPVRGMARASPSPTPFSLYPRCSFVAALLANASAGARL